MSTDKIKSLCRVCECKIYRNGEKADVRDGAILIRGGLQVQPGAAKLTGVGFIAPQKVDDEILAEAESDDYTVVLHFPTGLRDRVLAAAGAVNAAMVTSQHRMKFLKRGALYDEDDAFLVRA